MAFQLQDCPSCYSRWKSWQKGIWAAKQVFDQQKKYLSSKKGIWAAKRYLCSKKGIWSAKKSIWAAKRVFVQCTAGEIFVNEKSCIKFFAFFAKERQKKSWTQVRRRRKSWTQARRRRREKSWGTGEKKEEEEKDTGEKKEKEELTHRMSSSLSKSTLTWGGLGWVRQESSLHRGILLPAGQQQHLPSSRSRSSSSSRRGGGGTCLFRPQITQNLVNLHTTCFSICSDDRFSADFKCHMLACVQYNQCYLEWV